jgi:hypothetical protein
MENCPNLNKLEDLTKDELSEAIEEFGISESELEALLEKEELYRKKQGNTCIPDSNLCEFCRNNKKQQKFCWDCDCGSLYVPMTQPLFNLAIMYLLLEEGISSGNNAIQQVAFRDAIKTIIHPIGIEEVIKRYRNDLIKHQKGFSSIDELENVVSEYSFKQGEITEKEKESRKKIGTFRCHSNVCTHCAFSNQFNTIFCWQCDGGSNFRNGILSLEYFRRALMYINTAFGEGNGNEWKTYFAEGLKWAIKPYATEEELIDKYGFEYVTELEIDDLMKQEIDEYNQMYSGKPLY